MKMRIVKTSYVVVDKGFFFKPLCLCSTCITDSRTTNLSLLCNIKLFQGYGGSYGKENRWRGGQTGV